MTAAGRKAPFDQVFVDADLVVDDVQAAGQVAQLAGDMPLVPAQQLQTLSLGAVTAANNLSVLADSSQRHASLAEQNAQLQPVDVLLGIHAAAADPLDLLTEQASPFVKTQRVHAHPGTRGDLPDAQPLSGLIGIHGPTVPA
jgi:hypothetical protein